MGRWQARPVCQLPAAAAQITPNTDVESFPVPGPRLREGGARLLLVVLGA